MDSNFEILKAAGLIIGDEPLPGAYQAVVDDLTQDDLKEILYLKARFDVAERSIVGTPPYIERFGPPF